MTTTRQHLRADHGYDRVSRGGDVDRLHRMEHKMEIRRGYEEHKHDDAGAMLPLPDEESQVSE